MIVVEILIGFFFEALGADAFAYLLLISLYSYFMFASLLIVSSFFCNWSYC